MHKCNFDRSCWNIKVNITVHRKLVCNQFIWKITRYVTHIASLFGFDVKFVSAFETQSRRPRTVDQATHCRPGHALSTRPRTVAQATHCRAGRADRALSRRPRTGTQAALRHACPALARTTHTSTHAVVDCSCSAADSLLFSLLMSSRCLFLIQPIHVL